MSNSGGSFLTRTVQTAFKPEDFLGDEALMIRTAEQFSQNEVLPIQERLETQEEGLMPSLIQRAGALGFCGADTGEAYGGLGLSKNLAARMLEFLSLNASFSVTIGVTSGISQVGLSLFGTEEQKLKYLPSLASGEQIGAYCLSEPNSGSDALSLTTRAELKGDKYILNGTKMWISNAKWAEQFLVMAKIDGQHLAAFIVERGFPGLSISREEHKMGLKGSSTARVLLENCEVPVENLLHEPGKGHQVALNALNIGRFKLAAMSIGPARQAIAYGAEYAKDRKQFGKSISEFGLIRKKLAESAAWFYVAESMIYRTGAMIDAAFEEWGGSAEGNRKAAEEYAIECSACKVMSTEIEAWIADEMLQIYGGYGFTEEFPIARIYRDARISRIYEGTNEINRVFASDRLFKRVAEGRASLPTTRDSFVAELTTTAYGSVADFKALPQEHVGALSDLLMLTYAEQSARLRGSVDLYELILPQLNAKAAVAYQALTAEAVSLPSVARAQIDAVADAVLSGRLPYSA